MARNLEGLQRLGRALMLPIAVLPVAALLLRLGQPDLLDIHVLAATGDAIFSNLGMVFAVGVAVGFARENHGAAGLASLVGFLVATHGAEAMLNVPATVTAGLSGAAADLAASAWRSQQMAKLSMPVGVLSGLIAGFVYNRWSDIRMPSYLAFFGGRRFVPIATGCIGVLVGLAFGLGWPMLSRGMDSLTHAIVGAGSFGLFAYGVLNRALIVTGLHHILNNLVWFLLGDYHGATGDLKRFFAGDPTAGAFMSGFFPVMMFGLPGACLAMYRAARPERRRAVGGLLLSIALTSFLTGVTEPIEFTFMFLAPALYALHAVLTGLAMVLMHALGVHLGFGFSAGLFDYVLNFSLATRPLWLLPIGAAYFALYYVLFSYGIARFNLATPGRGAPEESEAKTGAAAESVAASGHRPAALVRALGGAANLASIDACTTRLRLTVVDGARVDAAALAQLGALGVVRPSPNAVQVVLGPIADQVAGEMRAYLRDGVAVVAGPGAAPAPLDFAALLAALGGAGNITAVEARAGRVLVRVAQARCIDMPTLEALVARGAVTTPAGVVHLLLGAQAEAVAAGLQSARTA
ncbi:MAG TPA: N-acetylglucosamine-specific PTS transporter subunit IIBC [Steroidobacteraceae bacterium]|nr:N-acetylglucosamine-specific PTS transporter subunit IIBC [Steroidobacteraceae bacterium]